MKGLISYRSVILTAGVTAVFSLVVCAMLLFDAANRITKVPLDSQEFLDLKDDFIANPQSKELKEELRKLDRDLRVEYFQEQDYTKSGALLLVAGIVATLVTGKYAATLRRTIPMPTVKPMGPDTDERLARTGFWAVAVLMISLLLTTWAMNASYDSHLPATRQELAALLNPETEPDQPTNDAVGVVDVDSSLPARLPTLEEFQKSWPSFRGPSGSGVSHHADVPTTWNAASGEGILWKSTETLLPGVNSPIVFGNRVFLSGADEKQREVYCFNADDGKLVWKKTFVAAPTESGKPVKRSVETGFAAPTLATDGLHVFAMFADADLIAFDFAGKEVWQRSLGVPVANHYGHAASLATFLNSEDSSSVIVQYDQGDVEEELSKLMAFDGATGKPLWETKRPVSVSWCSPVVVERGGKAQILTAGEPWVIGYEAATGKELWRAECLPNAEIGPTPAYSEGVVYTANDQADLTAIRTNGAGDVTQSHVLWTARDGMPETCSPLVTNEFVLLMDSYGLMTCYDKRLTADAEERELLWDEDFGADCTSSPARVGELVYLFFMDGKTIILKPTREKAERVVDTNDLGEECVTTPAFQDGRIYVRGKEHLICIGSESGAEDGSPALPTLGEFRKNWPAFRGSDGTGITHHKDVPTQWDAESGEGILWKTEDELLPGVNSPIVWNKRVFLSGADEKQREVYCIDADSGKLLWRKPVPKVVEAEPVKVSPDTGFAAPTMATDGRFVYAMYANADVVAFDFEGNELWKRGLGLPVGNNYGHSASLATYHVALIVQYDQGDMEEELSKLIALEGATGEPVWETKRPVPSSWCSPVVVQRDAKPQILTAADPWVIGYDADSGKELWRAECLKRAEVGPTPVFSEGVVYTANDQADLSAIRTDGTGDVTETHILWTARDGMPETVSPLVTDEFVLLLDSYGLMTCYDKKEGKELLWDEDFGSDCTSSPSLVGDLVYIFFLDGTSLVIKPTREEAERVVESNTLGEECVTSPAFGDGRIYIRGKDHLFCIGRP